MLQWEFELQGTLLDDPIRGRQAYLQEEIHAALVHADSKGIFFSFLLGSLAQPLAATNPNSHFSPFQIKLHAPHGRLEDSMKESSEKLKGTRYKFRGKL